MLRESVSGRLSDFLLRSGERDGDEELARGAGVHGGADGLGAVSSASDWCTVHCPQSVAELCVANRKVTDVQRWLELNTDVQRQQQQSVLLLTGPPGCGKWTMVDKASAAQLRWSG